MKYYNEFNQTILFLYDINSGITHLEEHTNLC